MKLSESKGYEVLMEMRNSLVDEQIILNSKLSKLYSDREELDLYVKALLEDEEIDIKVFTPRNLESKYKDHLAEKSKERAEIEEAIDAALSRRTMVDFKIDQLDIVLSEFRGLCDDGTPEQEEADVSHETLLLSLLENERSRIASDLHDGPVQELTAAIHKTELCEHYIQQDPLRARLELATVSKTLRNTITDTRKIIYNLRPMVLDDLGWKTAVRKMLPELKQDSRMDVKLVDTQTELQAEELVQITTYRIVQEAVTNALKHSDGQKIEVSLTETGEDYVLKIFDDGQSFEDPDPRSDDKNFGMKLMRERTEMIHGKFYIHHIPGEGTLVKVTFPKTIKN